MTIGVAHMDGLLEDGLQDAHCSTTLLAGFDLEVPLSVRKLVFLVRMAVVVAGSGEGYPYFSWTS